VDGVKQSQDSYAQRGKALTSSVHRLRSWVASDPARAPELADALVQLTRHRLLGHGYPAAAADAQDSVRLAAQLLTAKGPIGPYTALGDAARYITAVVQLAAIQTGLGLADAAGRTVASLADVREQVGAWRVDEQLAPQTVIWALLGSARAELAASNVPAANAYADAALDRLAESGLRTDPDSVFLRIDVDRLISDARWAAGHTRDALVYLHAASEAYEDLAGDRFEELSRLSPGLVERLAEPLSGVYGDLADRLVATGEVDLGLSIRRRLVDRLRLISERLAGSTHTELIQALTALARDLRTAGRLAEADAFTAEAATLAEASDPRDLSGPTLTDVKVPSAPAAGGSVTWAPLPPQSAYAATTAARQQSTPDPAVLLADRRARTAAWLAAARADARQSEQRLADLARAEAGRRDAERAAAERAAAARQAAEQARADEEQRLAAERQAATEEAERVERKQRRAERIAAHQLEVERREADRRAGELRGTKRRERKRALDRAPGGAEEDG
jgi:hypothetical protein